MGYSIANDIKDLPVLDHGDLCALVDKAQAGCTESRNTVVKHNIKLAYSVAKGRRLAPGQEFQDLWSDAVLGLFRAVDKFDTSSGFKFSTYAIWWVRQSISRQCQTYPLIRLPGYVGEKLRSFEKHKAAFAEENGREATPEETAKAMDISVEMVKGMDAAVHAGRWTSLHHEIGKEEGNLTFGDRMSAHTEPTSEVGACEEEAARVAWRMLLEEASISEKQIDILTMRYGLDGFEPVTLREIGELFGVSRERVRQIEVSALKALRATAERLGLEFTDLI